MSGFPVAAVLTGLLCTWGVAVFALLLWQRAWALTAPEPLRDPRPSGFPPMAAYALGCLALYGAPLASELLARAGPGHEAARDAVRVALLAALFLLPALLAHLFLLIERRHLPGRHGWGALAVLRAGVAALYLAGAGLLALWVRAAFGAVGWSEEPRLGPVHALTAASSALVLLVERLAAARDRGPSRRGLRRLFQLLAAASIATSSLSLAPLPPALRAAVGLGSLALPILFVLSTAYLQSRTGGFDRLVKQGVLALAALAALTAIELAVRPGPPGPDTWVLPAAALPVLLLAPWASARVSAWVDRAWLGRRRSPADAHRSLLAALGATADEPALLREAEALLGALFPRADGSPRAARITLGAAAPAAARAAPGAFDAPVGAGGEPLGRMRIETPPDERPFLSEDRQLFASLGQTLGSALENLRLRERRAAQERRERELTLLAGRAELKALRAQIDPHFLFNALNTVASLIPGDPARAEAVVERLAEVFRYTLRRSEREWVRVDEEVDFVRSYLEVEQVRFGPRLEVEVRVAEGARDAWIPAMMLSVLVENAMKHGVPRVPVRTPARVEIDVAAEGERLRIVVRDGGPGFPAHADAEADAPRDASGGEGHGLRNTRERLRVHFGSDAWLQSGRDEQRGLTEVELSLPRVAAPPARAVAP